VPGVRRYLSVFLGVLLMSLKLPHYLSDGRAPLVEVLGSPDFENTCDIFSVQITENSKKISQKSCKFSFLKDFFVPKYFLRLGISNRAYYMFLSTIC